MKSLLAAAALSTALLSPAVEAKNMEVIPVWNGPAPGSESWTWSEESNVSKRDKSLNVRNIVAPSLTVYRAKKPNGTGMMVSPGGGFRNLGYGKEGEEVAHWLNTLGVTAFVLKYRLARTGDADAADPAKLNARIEAVVPLAVADGKQAMRILHARAVEWGIKPGRLGAMGFSAGGYVTWNTAIDTDATIRPDFIAPIYSGAPDVLTAPGDAPPAFIALAEDDRFGTEGSINLYKAWHAAKRPVELHIYARGDHGFALRKSGIPTDSWNERLKDWLTLMGYLPTP